MIKERLYEIVESASYQEDTSSRVYDWIMYSAIILGLIPLMFRHTTKLLLWMDYVSCACFIVDYILRWYTNDIRRKKRHLDDDEFHKEHLKTNAHAF